MVGSLVIMQELGLGSFSIALLALIGSRERFHTSLPNGLRAQTVSFRG